jgi:signal transduction histidine kinase
VTIHLDGGDGRLTFVVADNGRGFHPDTPKGSGLQNMADRLAALDGTLDVSSTPGEGTTLTGRIPIQANGSG